MAADWAIECQLNSTVRAGRRGPAQPSFPRAHDPGEGERSPFLGFEGSGHINLSAEMPARDQGESLLP